MATARLSLEQKQSATAVVKSPPLSYPMTSFFDQFKHRVVIIQDDNALSPSNTVSSRNVSLRSRPNQSFLERTRQWEGPEGLMLSKSEDDEKEQLLSKSEDDEKEDVASCTDLPYRVIGEYSSLGPRVGDAESSQCCAI